MKEWKENIRPFILFCYELEYPKGGFHDFMGNYKSLPDALEVGKLWQSKRDVPDEAFFHVADFITCWIWNEDGEKMSMKSFTRDKKWMQGKG